MNSLHEQAEYEICDACTTPATDLRKYAGDAICDRCEELFTAGHALFDNGIAGEAEIIGTLAFTHFASDPSVEAASNYRHLEVVKVADNVPVMRLRKAAVTITTYENSDIPRAVGVEVLSRHVDPSEVFALYERALLEHDIHYDQCSGGAISWSTQNACLTILVKPEKELHPARVPYFKEYPRGRIYSFAPPSLVREVCRSLIGSAHKRTLSGYACALGDHGRSTKMTSEKTILGSMAWLLGEKDKSQKPGVRRPRIARVLNDHVLKPLDKPVLPEDGWTSEDTIWRDAAKVSQRLMRVGFFVQLSDTESFKQQFG